MSAPSIRPKSSAPERPTSVKPSTRTDGFRRVNVDQYAENNYQEEQQDDSAALSFNENEILAFVTQYASVIWSSSLSIPVLYQTHLWRVDSDSMFIACNYNLIL